MKPDLPNSPEPLTRETIPPDILAWARQTFDEADYLAAIREIEATGGVELEDFLTEQKTQARSQ
jgi:hypothetical protein